MEKKPFWRNSSWQLAIIAGLAAAIAAYLILAPGVLNGVIGKANDGKTTTKKRGEVENHTKRLTGRESGEEKMLTALRIADYEILKPRLKKGVRVNIISGYGEAQNAGPQGETILENVLIVEVPLNSSSRLSPREQGVLIEITKEESVRLAAAAGAESLRIMIKGE
jgi:hypothetical protein